MPTDGQGEKRMNSNPGLPTEPMDDFTNPDIGGHTEGDKGIPISEHTYTTPEGESATITTRARNPEFDENHGSHVNLVSEIDDVVGFDNTPAPVDPQDLG